MAYSNDWLRFHKSENEYFTCRYAFMQDEEKMVNDLNTALSHVGDIETALRFLLEVSQPTSVIVPLLSKIVDASIDSSNLNTIKLARSAIHNYKDEILIRINIEIFVNNYLSRNDDWHYRRIAELYTSLNYKEELIRFISICRTNDNVEIQEVGDDFHSALD